MGHLAIVGSLVGEWVCLNCLQYNYLIRGAQVEWPGKQAQQQRVSRCWGG